MRKFGNGPRYTFTLNVDTHLLDGQLGCVPLQKIIRDVPPNSTSIENIIPESSYGFLDPYKKSKRWMITMRNYISKEKLPQQVKDVVCHWCHFEFTGAPLGCPVQFVETRRSSSYFSHSNKKEIEVPGDVVDSYYLTDGIFCGWGCQMGFAINNQPRITHRESVQLVGKMFSESGGIGLPPPSPPFTIRKRYGGELSDEDYKNKSHIDTYRPVNNFYIRMIPVGEIFEVTSKF